MVGCLLGLALFLLTMFYFSSAAGIFPDAGSGTREWAMRTLGHIGGIVTAVGLLGCFWWSRRRTGPAGGGS